MRQHGEGRQQEETRRRGRRELWPAAMVKGCVDASCSSLSNQLLFLPAKVVVPALEPVGRAMPLGYGLLRMLAIGVRPSSVEFTILVLVLNPAVWKISLFGLLM